MFGGLADEIKSLNADVKNVANSQRARSLRNKLLGIGIPLAVLGFGAMFVCFALFATAGMDGFDTEHGGFTARLLVPFLLFVPCGIVGGVGARIASLGFKIVVTGYTTKLIDDTVGNNCPQCGTKIGADELYCAQCGQRVRLECPHCHQINQPKNVYCAKCGTKLKN